ncbi:hypothetical protein P9112_002277 [Eukaryota sp. TZLM1-RC]
MEELCTALASSSCTRSLKFSNCHITSSSMQLLCDSLPQTSIQCLAFVSCNLSNIMSPLSHFISSTSSLEMLSLRCCSLTSCSSFYTSLRTNKSLKALSLFGCDVDPVNISQVVRGVCALRYLDLSNTQLDCTHLVKFLDFFKPFEADIDERNEIEAFIKQKKGKGGKVKKGAQNDDFDCKVPTINDGIVEGNQSIMKLDLRSIFNTNNGRVKSKVTDIKRDLEREIEVLI